MIWNKLFAINIIFRLNDCKQNKIMVNCSTWETCWGMIDWIIKYEVCHFSTTNRTEWNCNNNANFQTVQMKSQFFSNHQRKLTYQDMFKEKKKLQFLKHSGNTNNALFWEYQPTWHSTTGSTNGISVGWSCLLINGSPEGILRETCLKTCFFFFFFVKVLVAQK